MTISEYQTGAAILLPQRHPPAKYFASPHPRYLSPKMPAGKRGHRPSLRPERIKRAAKVASAIATAASTTAPAQHADTYPPAPLRLCGLTLDLRLARARAAKRADGEAHDSAGVARPRREARTGGSCANRGSGGEEGSGCRGGIDAGQAYYSAGVACGCGEARAGGGGRCCGGEAGR